MDISSLIRGKALVLRRDATLREAVRVMADHNIGLLPIVDDKGRPLAVISERDVVRAWRLGHRLIAPSWRRAEEALITVTPDADVYEAMVKMRRGGVRHLLVVDREGRLVGVVSIRDFMRDDVLAYLGFKAWQPPDYGQPEFMSL
ncbi:MAG: signal transduction protein [Thermoproteus sp. CIS_19]|nr:MAG: signal transduction protein [Thermoproteus sp. CIS_19]